MEMCEDRPNLIERLILKLGKPENQARLIQVAWKISLLMMILGMLVIIKTVSPNFM
jgi:hypothetical protein